MRSLTAILFVLISGMSLAQVGINTLEPTSTLDVNGALRIRGLNGRSSNAPIAVRVVGIDAAGNLVEVETADNIVLENNFLRAVETKLEFGEIPDINASVVNNLSLIIVPGGPNEKKKVIRIRNSFGNTDITGIEAAQDGTIVWLYAVDGRIRLFANDANSDPDNQILSNGNTVVQQYGMIQLIYDGTENKWVPMRR